MKTKKQELLELSYEHGKSWLLSILTVIVVLTVALPNLPGKETKLFIILFLRKVFN